MARRNRVTPLGEIVAEPARGLVFGNRGCLHDEHGRLRRSHRGRRWIACRLRFRDRRRDLMQPGRYTELFFLDDATALAAGHRPCAECRREDYTRLVEQWPRRLPAGSPAQAIDAELHAERLTESGLQRHHEANLDQLADGVVVVRDDAPWLVCGDQLLRWTPAGYTDPLPRPANTRATVVTPPSLAAVLAAGWRPVCVPFLHPSLDGAGR